MRPSNRVPLVGQPQQYQTYSVVSPKDTHTRPATCAEVDCRHHREGWQSIIDTGTDLGKAQAEWIRHQSGRHFTEDRTGPTVITFLFGPGQTCFANNHVVTVEREPFYILRPGLNHTPTGPVTRYDRADQWVDDFATHQDHLADELG